MESRRFKKCTICGVRKFPKSGTFLAKFPLDPDRCRLWVKASGIEDLVYVPIEKLYQLKYVCGAHFARECFNAKGNRLLGTAVPTEGLTRPPLSDDLFAEFPLYVSGYLAAKVLTKFNCENCKYSLKEENPNLDEPLYKFISLKVWWQDKISLTYPKKELCILVNEAKNIYETSVLPQLHQPHIVQYCTLQLSIHCNMEWLQCHAHSKFVHDYLLTFLSKLFIRKSCKILNNDFFKSEIDVADKIKRAQQQNKDL